MSTRGKARKSSASGTASAGGTGRTRSVARAARRFAELPVIGWREWVELPDLGVEGVKVKVDTGARSSALHAWNIHLYERGGRRFVAFDIHPLQRIHTGSVRARAELVDLRRVRSSSGHSEERPVIHTTLVLGGFRQEIELTLTRRDEMGFRMLLGREALRRRYLIHPGRSFLQGKPPG